MAIRILTLLILGYACAAPAVNNVGSSKIAADVDPQEANQETDLKPDASTCK